MALQKTLTHPTNGNSGNYIRLVARSWNRDQQSFSCHFVLFLSESFAKSTLSNGLMPTPIDNCAGKMTVSGALFAQYFSNAALAALGGGMAAETAQAYVVALAHPELVSSNYNTRDSAGNLIGAFSGATTVLEAGQTAPSN
jgi:hypothetical protein